MQSAIASLRSAGPTKAVKNADGSAYWGIGSEDLTLSGHYSFQVVSGAVALCGTTLTSGPTFHHVSAPLAPFPSFKPVHAQDAEPGHAVDGLEAYNTVILVRPAGLPTDLSAIAPPYQSLWHPLFRVDNLQATNRLEIPKSWSGIDASASRIVVLGPMNSGKSTLARFLTNRALVNNSRVFYLELDPGQPEFTPPGCLALHLLSDKDLNFSPPYAHPGFGHAVKAHHLGYPSPGETPHRYIAMCEDLVAKYLELARPTDVLIVNTPGWTKGLGLELNSAVAEMIQPATLIHLGPSEFGLEHLKITEVSKINLVGDESAATTVTASGFSSAELRALQLISYFHQENNEPLTSWAPYEVPLGLDKAGIRALVVMDSAGIDLNEDLAVCVEGLIVSINVVHTDDALPSVILPEEQADNIWQISSCVGLAVVQSLSLETGVVRLLTPVDPAALDLGSKRVVLCRGRIQLPIWEMQNRALNSTLPWVSTTKAPGIGASYTKFRRNLLR